MKYAASIAMILALAGSAGESSADEQHPVPFDSEPASSGAYQTSETMEVFIVWDSDVIAVMFDLPEEPTGILVMDTGSGCPCTITHYHGHGISTYVLPSGPAVPIPEGYQYSSREAISGTAIFGNVPERTVFEPGAVITVVLDGIDFGDGDTRSYGPVEVVTGVYPP